MENFANIELKCSCMQADVYVFCGDTGEKRAIHTTTRLQIQIQVVWCVYIQVYTQIDRTLWDRLIQCVLCGLILPRQVVIGIYGNHVAF